ncbi:DsrE/DsrF/DrsH-like family protein [Indioceanicola profundi]|uniref:DsrE/DsrF/DrsH-like family protein n=1 Tax=Indioceanicola profundi TaxID=2220096 RepID=UPI000E6AB109|nr:DsrE/DsrF/DrsH-like family protein [Indioceanicola profundi]
MPEGSQGLAIVIHAGGYDRVHYALVLASGAAATGRPVTLFFTGRALPALMDGQGWRQLDPADDGTPAAEREAVLEARRVATMEELLEACGELDVRFLACEMGWRALGVEKPVLRPGLAVETAGVVTLLGGVPPGHHLVFV